MSDRDALFNAWKEEALDVPLLEAAAAVGAQLKRAGSEYEGPCPACGGTDRFSVNPSRSVWNCRNAQGGHDAIGLVMHAGDMSFKEAVELLTGRPCPTGREEMTPEEKEARLQRRLASERRQAEDQAREENDKDAKRRRAYEIWKESTALIGSVAELYLRGRGVDYDLTPFARSLRCHPRLRYPGEDRAFPALIAAVQAPDERGTFLGIWRIYLNDRGAGKAPVENPKLGLGNYTDQGGCVRLGNPSAWGNVCEGLETGMGVYGLLDGREGVQCSLSTSGMVNWKPPLGVERTRIWPDGDTDKIRSTAKGEKLLKKAGPTAAATLAERLKGENHPNMIQPYDELGRDFLDIYVAARRTNVPR